jgi:hypothetical protein
MHEREFKRIRATIEADYRKKLDALELVYSMAAKNGASSSAAPVKGKLAQAVVEAIQHTDAQFSARDIETLVSVTRPELAAKRASISNTLKRLEGREIELIEKGSGKRPSTYRRRTRSG